MCNGGKDVRKTSIFFRPITIFKTLSIYLHTTSLSRALLCVALELLGRWEVPKKTLSCSGTPSFHYAMCRRYSSGGIVCRYIRTSNGCKG